MQFYFMCISFRRKVTYTNTYDMCYSKKRHCRRFMLVSNVNQCIQMFFFLKKRNKNIYQSNIGLWVASCYYISGYIMSGSHQLTRCTVYTITCWLWGSTIVRWLVPMVDPLHSRSGQFHISSVLLVLFCFCLSSMCCLLYCCPVTKYSA